MSSWFSTWLNTGTTLPFFLPYKSTVAKLTYNADRTEETH